MRCAYPPYGLGPFLFLCLVLTAVVGDSPAGAADVAGSVAGSVADSAPDPAPDADTTGPLRFFAVGDLPYGEPEVAPLRALLAAAARRHPPFIVHVGDIKGGSTPCTDAQLESVAALFRALPVPVVYTPGDNEWTDCRRAAAGGYDPRERLKRLREVFFADPGVLRLAGLSVVRAAKGFPEVYAFNLDGVLFAALHVVGSDDGYNPRDSAALAEWSARTAANRALLDKALGAEPGRSARALVILIQADPFFERGAGPSGLRPFKKLLVDIMARFAGPVLLVHGDTHWYRHDHPLLDPARGVPFERFTRIEVPGSPFVGGVWIRVDPGAAEPFASDPQYAVSLDGLEPGAPGFGD